MWIKEGCRVNEVERVLGGRIKLGVIAVCYTTQMKIAYTIWQPTIGERSANHNCIKKCFGQIKDDIIVSSHC